MFGFKGVDQYMKEETVKKNISPDRAYIDYTSANSGVRTWKNKCHSIARFKPESEWRRTSEIYPIPMDDSASGELLPLRPIRLTPIMLAISRLEGTPNGDELGRIVRGTLFFEVAVSTL
jgi:hypothetical protein